MINFKYIIHSCREKIDMNTDFKLSDLIIIKSAIEEIFQNANKKNIKTIMIPILAGAQAGFLFN